MGRAISTLPARPNLLTPIPCSGHRILSSAMAACAKPCSLQAEGNDCAEQLCRIITGMCDDGDVRVASWLRLPDVDHGGGGPSSATKRSCSERPTWHHQGSESRICPRRGSFAGASSTQV